MSYGRAALFIIAVVVVLAPLHSPAPFMYTPGEGWYYETPGQTSNWQRSRARDQMAVAQQYFHERDFSNALRAAARVVQVWPLSDYAPDAQYLIGRCLEEKHRDEAAFKAYQTIIDKFPNSPRYEEVTWRQYAIANRFLGGEWTKLWNVVPFFPSMDTAADMFGSVVTNGPYSDAAPHAQLRIGVAREKQSDFPSAVDAYGLAADRYHDMPAIAADAVFRKAESYRKEAAKAEYDQSTAQQAIDTYIDFITMYPDDKRVSGAHKAIDELKAEQVHGAFEVAEFYEKYHKWDGAAIYYNEVLQLDPNSPYAETARRRIQVLKPRLHVSED